jgi:glycosyltransferase involved in cell wall biosynthesis
VSEPVFSLIMAAYNAADVIHAAIGSALRQTLTDFELIVVDDGSTDGTGEIVAALAAQDPRIRLLTQANAGANATRNRAISEARGRYVTFLDSDDLKLPGYLGPSPPGSRRARGPAWPTPTRTSSTTRRAACTA